MPEFLDTSPENLANPARIDECKAHGHKPLKIGGLVQAMPITHPSGRTYGTIHFCARCGTCYWDLMPELRGGILDTQTYFGIPPNQGRPP